MKKVLIEAFILRPTIFISKIIVCLKKQMSNKSLKYWSG